MEIFNKKNLELKETTYKKKNVILKEDEKVYLNNTSGIVNAVNDDGNVTVSKNPNQTKNLDVKVYTTGSTITPHDIENSEQVQSAFEIAQQTPNTDVEITGYKVNGLVTPLQTNSTSTTKQISEGVVFTKQEMNNFLKTL